MEGKTAIAIAHQVNSVASLACIIVLDHGRIMEDSSHSELLERIGLYASVWSRQPGGLIDTENREAAE